MKLTILLIPTLLTAADLSTIQQLFDAKLSPTQRANACFALRNNSDPEVLRAMTRAMEDQELISCAAENLRLAHAVDALEHSLASPNEQTRSAAARELGTFRDPALLDSLARAAEDPNALVASNALAALSEYSDPAVIPHLAALAKKGGMIGDMALERLLQLDPSTALPIARVLLQSPQVPDKLYAMRTLGVTGDQSDLPELRKIAASTEQPSAQHSRGFGFMPPINLARAAQSAIAGIEGKAR
jgi:HEAT repeat protein